MLPEPQLVQKDFWTSWWTGKQTFPPWPPLPDFAETLRIPVAESARRRYFRKIRSMAAVHAADHDYSAKKASALRTFPGFR